MTLAVLRITAPAASFDCLWSEPLNGLDTQCMGLGAAPLGRGSQAECEAYCCNHRVGNPTSATMKTEDGVSTGTYCGVWQWMPPSQMPDATYKWSCFVGDSEKQYTCGKSQGELAPVKWAGGRKCLGLAPDNWGLTFVVVFGLGTALYVGGGSMIGARAYAGSASLRAHPHYQRWTEIRGLCADGLSFIRGGRRTPAGHKECSGYAVAPSGEKRKKSKSSKHSSTSSSSSSDKKSAQEPTQRMHLETRNTSARAKAVSSTDTSTVQEPGRSVAAGGGGRWVHVES